MEILKLILLFLSYVCCGTVTYYLGYSHTTNQWALRECESQLKSEVKKVEMLNKGFITINGVKYDLKKHQEDEENG